MDELALGRNLSVYGPFAATERVLMALGKAGADRQEMHERIRFLTLQAWESVSHSEPNPLVELVVNDPEFLSYLSAAELNLLMDASNYVGDAPNRALAFAKQVRKTVTK